MTGSEVTRRRRRRADAEQSVARILDAAGRLLGQNPHASIEDIATAAGLTRQTIYAHFASRDALVCAVADRATDRATAALKAVDFSQGPAGEALLRLVQISWETFANEPFLLSVPSPPMDPDSERERHQPVFETLESIIRRGHREGDFDPDLPITWIIAATAALGHAAGDEVRAERMTSSQASAVLRRALQRLFAT
jgi:AcrR family transcriptional regulator